MYDNNLNYQMIYNFPEVNLNNAKKFIEENTSDVNEFVILKSRHYLSNYIVTEVPVPLLYAAVTNSNEELVDYLLTKEANVNISVGNNTSNAVHKAIIQKNLVILQKLIDHNADLEHSIQPGDNKPLHTAIHTKSHAIIECLVKEGVDVKDAFKNSTSYPYSWVLSTESCYTITLLWENGAKLWNYKTPQEFFSSMLSEAASRGDDTPLENLFALDANLDSTYVNKLDGKTYPILHRSVYLNRLHSLVLLLEYYKFEPAYINVLTENRQSLLHIAVRQEILQRQVEIRFNYPQFYDKWLEVSNHVINHLLSADIDVNLVDNYGKLASDYVSDYNSYLILRIKKHIVKLITIGRYVCQRNAEAVRGEEFNDFRDQCRKEVKKMKATMIGTSNLSFYSVLEQSIHKSALYLKHVDLQTIIWMSFNNTHKKTYSEMFPLYGGLIYYKLIKVPKRIELLKKVNGILEEIFRRILPNTFIHLIYYYLTHDDLKKLCEL